MSFWDNLEKVMEQKDLTPYKIHKGTGISQGTISRWKNQGQIPSGRTLQTLSDFLGVPASYLLDDKNEDKKKSSTDLAAWEDALRAIGALNPDGTVDKERIDAFIEFEKSAQKLGATKKK